MRRVLVVLSLLALSTACEAGFSVPVGLVARSSATAPTVTSLSPSSGETSSAVGFVGTNLTGATAVAFNGTSASFIVVDSTHITAIVPNTATTGTVSVTTPSGTATGPTYTIVANTFAFDLTTTTFPTGLTASRTGSDTFYLQRSISTMVASTSTSLIEDYGDGNGGGTWTFDGYYNGVPSPFDFSTGWTAIGSPTITTNTATGPDGVANADTVADSSAVESRGLGLAGSTPPTSNVPTMSTLWVKPVPGAIPTLAGAVGGLYDVGVVYNGTTNGTNSDWRCIRASWLKVGGFSNYEYIGFFPAGATPPAGADPSTLTALTLTASSTGSLYVSAAQAARARGSVPVVAGSTGAATIAAVTPANVLAPNGDFHIEGGYLMDGQTQSASAATDAESFFAMATPDGAFNLMWGQSLVVNGTFRGVASSTSGASVNVGAQDQGKQFTYEAWYLPSTGAYGMQFKTNGHRQASGRFTGTGATAFGTPTAFHLGHDAGTKILPRRHTFIRKTTQSIDAAEGVGLGDSIVSLYAAYSPVGTYIYTTAESRSRSGIVSYAYPGNTIAQQATAWASAPQRGAAGVAWVWLHLGINSLNAGGLSAAAATAELQALINDINTQNPTAKIIIDPIMPCLASVGGVVWAKAVTFNQNIAGTGPNPITGSNRITLPYWTAADDGSGNLIAAFDSGDGIHQNTAARQYMAAIVRAALVTAGLL